MATTLLRPSNCLVRSFPEFKRMRLTRYGMAEPCQDTRRLSSFSRLIAERPQSTQVVYRRYPNRSGVRLEAIPARPVRTFVQRY